MVLEKGVLYQGGVSKRLGAVGAKFLFAYWAGQPVDMKVMHLFMHQTLYGPFSGMLASIDPKISYPALNTLHVNDVPVLQEDGDDIGKPNLPN